MDAGRVSACAMSRVMPLAWPATWSENIISGKFATLRYENGYTRWQATKYRNVEKKYRAFEEKPAPGDRTGKARRKFAEGRINDGIGAGK